MTTAADRQAEITTFKGWILGPENTIDYWEPNPIIN